MLKEITLENFKSYKKAALPLAPLTVLIGANASGKSNAIEGMRLLSWLAQGGKLSTIQHALKGGDRVVRGRIADLAYRQDEGFSLGCRVIHNEWTTLSMSISRREDELHIVAENIAGPAEKVPLYDLDQPSSGRGADAGVAYNNFSRGRNKPHVTCSDQSAIFTQLTSSATFSADYAQSQKDIPAVTRLYEQWLSAILFLDPAPARMRDYSFPSEKRLLADGGNLSGVLFNLWGTEVQAPIEPFATQRLDIVSFIQSLPEQDIKGISFIKEPRGGVMVSLTETFGNVERSYDASLLSDGTLRVLAIAAAMLSAPEGSLVVIEEIDNGVHPSRAQHLLKQIQAIAQRRKLRVLLSTHNPALLDALPDSAVPDVVFCYRDPREGSSRLVRLEDVPDYPELIAQGSLGHLVTARVLENFVKNRPSPDERKQKARAWLQSIRTEAS